eukprot:scaffold47897_cov63-Phaeocystis_antarctica.AAC.4
MDGGAAWRRSRLTSAVGSRRHRVEGHVLKQLRKRSVGEHAQPWFQPVREESAEAACRAPCQPEGWRRASHKQCLDSARIIGAEHCGHRTQEDERAPRHLHVELDRSGLIFGAAKVKDHDLPPTGIPCRSELIEVNRIYHCGINHTVAYERDKVDTPEPGKLDRAAIVVVPAQKASGPVAAHEQR